MIEKLRKLMELHFSGTVVDGAGHGLIGPDGEICGFYVPTVDGRHHIVDTGTGDELGAFESKEAAIEFARRQWPIARAG